MGLHKCEVYRKEDKLKTKRYLVTRQKKGFQGRKSNHSIWCGCYSAMPRLLTIKPQSKSESPLSWEYCLLLAGSCIFLELAISLKEPYTQGSISSPEVDPVP